MTAHAQKCDDCFKDFIVRTAHNIDLRHRFTTMIKGNWHGSVRGWFNDHPAYIGDMEVKVRFALQHIGYSVTELASMDSVPRDFAKHVAFGLFSVDNAAELLDISRQHILRIISGRSSTSSDRYDLMQLYNDEHAAALVELNQRLDEEGRIISKGMLQSHVLPRIHESPQPPKEHSFTNGSVLATNNGLAKQDAIAAFLGLVMAMRPLTAFLASDSCTAEDRELIRQEAGSYTIFHLKNDLIKLCGERARTIVEG